MALNALTLPMVRSLYAAYQDLGDVGCIVMRGEGKAFCAGGDVVAVWESARVFGTEAPESILYS